MYVSDLAEKAGDLKPTGSKRYSSKIHFQTTIGMSHLNSGTGYPWDWHSKTIEFLELFLKRVPSKSEDSVGDLNPMGSNKYTFKLLTAIMNTFTNIFKIWMLEIRYLI